MEASAIQTQCPYDKTKSCEHVKVASVKIAVLEKRLAQRDKVIKEQESMGVMQISYSGVREMENEKLRAKIAELQRENQELVQSKADAELAQLHLRAERKAAKTHQEAEQKMKAQTKAAAQEAAKAKEELAKVLAEIRAVAESANSRAERAEREAKEAKTEAKEAQTEAKEANARAERAEREAKEAKTDAKEANTRAAKLERDMFFIHCRSLVTFARDAMAKTKATKDWESWCQDFPESDVQDEQFANFLGAPVEEVKLLHSLTKTRNIIAHPSLDVVLGQDLVASAAIHLPQLTALVKSMLDHVSESP